jgi:hypothetical protein
MMTRRLLESGFRGGSTLEGVSLQMSKRKVSCGAVKGSIHLHYSK